MDSTRPAPMPSGSRLSAWLSRAPAPLFTAWALSAAFVAYFCMYAFRKPFAVGTFDGAVELPGLGPLDLKTLYIVAQVVGYAASKFLGIKLVSETTAGRRAGAIVVCIVVAEGALGLFAVTPPPYAAVWMIANGLPLGMVWGLVFGFLEGRRTSDVLGAGLCTSFIVASGFMKTAGRLVLDAGVPERFMPVATGALFLPPLLGAVWMLSRLPPPSADDEALRTRRAPMDAAARRSFFRRHALGLTALVALYVLLTAYRDFRDNFARELWDALGHGAEPALLTTAELPVALGALVAVALLMGVRDNRKALVAVHAIMLAGALLVGVSTLAYRAGLVSPATWMVSVGLGLYLGYVPFNCILFDRLVAAVGSVATAGFLIYVADAWGYAGSVGLLLFRSFGRAELSFVEFFVTLSYVTSAVCGALFLVSAAYFWRQTRQTAPGSDAPLAGAG